MPQSLSTLVAIPELALMLAHHLRQRDYCRLCLTCKSIHQVFQPLVWHDFEYNQFDYKNHKRSSPSPFLAVNQVHVRNLRVVLDGESYYSRRDYTLAIYDLLFGPEAQATAEQGEEESGTQETDLTSIENNNNDNERQCTNLQKFDFTMDSTIDSWSPCGVREDMVRLFLKDVMRLNIHLTDLSLHTRLVIEFEDEFMKAFMSLSQLRSLTVSLYEADEPTHPRALKMLLQLGQHHPSLQSIDFAGVCGGWRPCIAFRPDHMTDEDEKELDRQDEEHDREEVELMATIVKQFKDTPSSDSGITFPRIRGLKLPPRRYYPYPKSFLEALRREGVVPNLCSLIAPQGVRHGE